MQGYAGYPPPPMPPINMMPAGPNIPITPGLPNIGATPGFNPAEFDLPVTGGGNSNNQGNNQNGFEDFNVDQALGANDNDNGNAGNNDLNSELANLANPAAVGGANRNNNNNNNNNNALSANAAQIPTSLNDFQIDGLGGNSNGNLNNNGNNNAGNNAFNGLPTDILSQLGAANPNPSNNNNNGNGDFGDLGLGNLGGNSPARSNNGQDFNFGGSNNNMNFDLNFPAASDIQNHKIHRLELNMKKLAKDRLHKLVAADSKLLKQAQRSVLKGKDEKPGKLV